MSAEYVHNAMLKTFRGNTEVFSALLTGTASSSGSTVTGMGTLFSTELAVGDYIGTTVKGFRKVISITDNQHLAVASAFDSDLNNDNVRLSNIFKGMSRNVDISKIGKAMCIMYHGSADIPIEEGRAPVGMRVRAAYGFSISIIFFEPNDETAEHRKSEYDSLIRDIIDNNMDFGDSTIMANTIPGESTVIGHPDMAGLYCLTITVLCFRNETMGNR